MVFKQTPMIESMEIAVVRIFDNSDNIVTNVVIFLKRRDC